MCSITRAGDIPRSASTRLCQARPVLECQPFEHPFKVIYVAPFIVLHCTLSFGVFFLEESTTVIR